MALFRRANGYFIEGKKFAKKILFKAEFFLFHVCPPPPLNWVNLHKPPATLSPGLANNE